MLVLFPGWSGLRRLPMALARRQQVFWLDFVVPDAVVGWLLRLLTLCRLMAPLSSLFTADERFFIGAVNVIHSGLFKDVEATAYRDLGLDRVAALPDYAIALRHTACQYILDSLRVIVFLKDYAEHPALAQAEFVGFSKHVVSWYRVCFGSPPSQSLAITSDIAYGKNFLWALLVAGSIALKVAKAVSLSPRRHPQALLGADATNAPKHIYLLREAVASPDNLLLFPRNRAQAATLNGWPPATGLKIADAEKAELSPKEALSLLTLGWRDLLLLFWGLRAFPARVLIQGLKLAYWRVFFRALFLTYPVRNFLAKDDYNAEHAIRSQELRRIGAKSLGIIHGLPVPNIIDPLFRHLDFDIYYIYGKSPFIPDYQAYWPTWMQVKPVGSYGMTREQLEQAGKARDGDILFFISRLPQERDYMAIARRLALAFPDRKVLVKPKYIKGSARYVDFMKDLDAPENLIETSQNSYELMLTCRYAISNGSSSVAAEAVQFGLMTYVWDCYERSRPFFYRQFEGMCFTEADDLIERIRGIELGVRIYPWTDLTDLAVGPDVNVFDVLHDDVNAGASAAPFSR